MSGPRAAVRGAWAAGLPLSRHQRGFGLLEALVAMAIAAMAFSALYGAVGQGSKSASDINARSEAALVGRSVLASGVFAEDFIANASGSFGVWRWTVQVSPAEIPMVDAVKGVALAPLRGAQVEVRVLDDRQPGQPSVWSGWKPSREPAS